jgi:APA family basic amino acid/polyamine antiporter
LILRYTKPDLKRPFRVPLSPVLPIVSALACLYLMSNLSVETWIRFLVWLVLGMVIYLGYGRRNAASPPGISPRPCRPCASRSRPPG